MTESVVTSPENMSSPCSVCEHWLQKCLGLLLGLLPKTSLGMLLSRVVFCILPFKNPGIADMETHLDPRSWASTVCTCLWVPCVSAVTLTQPTKHGAEGCAWNGADRKAWLEQEAVPPLTYKAVGRRRGPELWLQRPFGQLMALSWCPAQLGGEKRKGKGDKASGVK